MRRAICGAILIGATWAAADPATQPAPNDVDFLLSQGKPAETQPADSIPTTQPVSPFANQDTSSWRSGVITLSNGERISGLIGHTPFKPIRVWVAEKSEYRDVPFSMVRSIESQVVWERCEKEWHFKQSGSDIKEYSGETYPARLMQYTIIMTTGEKVTGGVVEPLYVQLPDGPETFALHKRDKGEIGQTLAQLVYVKRVEFTPSPTTQNAP